MNNFEQFHNTLKQTYEIYNMPEYKAMLHFFNPETHQVEIIEEKPIELKLEALNIAI